MTRTAARPARIRWEDAPPLAGGVYLIASIGYVGTIEEPAFRIYTPDEIHARWLLSIRLTAGSQFRYADGPDQLKAEAERWLAGFISSLGAPFPEPVPPHPEEEAGR
jgi:hypothetical protein